MSRFPRLLQPLVALPTLVAWINCVPLEVTSLPSRGFNEKIDKVFIIISGIDGLHGNFFSELETRLPEALEKRGVKAAAQLNNPMDLQSEDHIKKMLESFSPNYILNVKAGRVTISGFQNTCNLIEFKLTRPYSEAPLWRASISMHGMNYSPGMTPNGVSSELIKLLASDALLPESKK